MMQGREGFKYTAEEHVSILFLEDFHRRYNMLLDAIGVYISKYNLFTSHFLTSGQKAEKEALLTTIKANFTPVLFMLESISSAVKNDKVSELIKDLKGIHNKVIHSDEISLDDLIAINEKLSKIIALLLLTPIIRKIPEKAWRIMGTTEVE